jgi:hypothetical protein
MRYGPGIDKRARRSNVGRSGIYLLGRRGLGSRAKLRRWRTRSCITGGRDRMSWTLRLGRGLLGFRILGLRGVGSWDERCIRGRECYMAD